MHYFLLLFCRARVLRDGSGGVMCHAGFDRRLRWGMHNRIAAAAAQVFDRLAHSSIMRLNTNSMDKVRAGACVCMGGPGAVLGAGAGGGPLACLTAMVQLYDLMSMGFKYHFLACSTPSYYMQVGETPPPLRGAGVERHTGRRQRGALAHLDAFYICISRVGARIRERTAQIARCRR